MTAKWNYWHGPDEEDRRIKYAKAFKPEYQANGDATQRLIAAIETPFRAETGIELPEGFASGWRPPAVNEATTNAGKLSAHLTAEAGDRRDLPDGNFAWWCFANPHVLEAHGGYMEHPVATVIRAYNTALVQKRAPTPWCHLTSRAPASHLRVYWPDGKAVAEWQALLDLGGYAGITYEAWKALQPTRRVPKEEE